MVCFQSTPTSGGRSLWIRICGAWNCSRRATVRLGIDTLNVTILVFICFNKLFMAALCNRAGHIVILWFLLLLLILLLLPLLLLFLLLLLVSFFLFFLA